MHNSHPLMFDGAQAGAGIELLSQDHLAAANPQGHRPIHGRHGAEEWDRHVQAVFFREIDRSADIPGLAPDLMGKNGPLGLRRRARRISDDTRTVHVIDHVGDIKAGFGRQGPVGYP